MINPLVEAGDFRDWHQQIDEWRASDPMTYEQRDDVIMPQYVLEQFSKLARGEFIMTTGVGQHQMWAAQWTKLKHPRTWITSGGLGSMGYGLPAAMGAQAAFPDALVVDIDGDGSFVMNIQELATVHCEKLPVKVIVLNNQHLGMVVQWEDRFYASNRAHTYLGPIHHPEATGQGDGEMPESLYPDLVEIARGFGVKARHVRDKAEVVDALAEMIAHPGPYVLDVMIPYQEHVLPMIPAGMTVRDIIKRAELVGSGRRKVAPIESGCFASREHVAAIVVASIGPGGFIDQEVVLLHLLVERGPVDVEHPRRLLAVPVKSLKCLDDDPFFWFFQGFLQGPDSHFEMRARHAAGDCPGLAMVVEDRCQVARGDPWAVAKGDRALNGGFELADIAWPVVFLQDVERIPGEAADGLVKLAGVAVFGTIRPRARCRSRGVEGGEHQADHADPMIELLAKAALLDQGG